MSHPAVNVGTPHPEFATELWSTTEVYYHGFEELPAVKDQGVLSPQFTCFGCQWCLVLYPAGDHRSDDGMVGIFIKNMSRERMATYFGFSIKNSTGKEMMHKYTTRKIDIEPSTVVGDASDYSGGKGYKNFIERSIVLNSLVKGALVIDVAMKPDEPTSQLPCPFIAPNPFCSSMLKLFMDEESADAAFVVGGQGRASHAKKRAKTAADIQTFYAHRLILKNCAPQLAEMCGSGGEDAPVPIEDVKPEIFRHILYYIYGGEVPDNDMKEHAKGIIGAADKYGVSTLKLEAEACYVNTTTITVDNVMDNLQYAECMNCALLKEAVMDFIVENKMEVLKNVSFQDAQANITDILVAVARSDKKGGNADGSANQFSTMRIGELRRKAHERGLNVDGSREALIASLENES